MLNKLKDMSEKFRVIETNLWSNGMVTKNTLGQNLSSAEAEKLSHGAISNPDDSRLETTTTIEREDSVSDK